MIKKFRTFDAKARKFIYFPHIHIVDKEFFEEQERSGEPIETDGFTLFSDDENLQQWTGLKDKNGKDIYEGDILECPWNFDPKFKEVGEVVFWAGEFCLSRGPEKDPDWAKICPFNLFGANDQPAHKYWWKDSTIIGNSFENPEIMSNF